MLIMNLAEEENLTGVVLLTDKGFARYVFNAGNVLVSTSQLYNSPNCRTVYQICSKYSK